MSPIPPQIAHSTESGLTLFRAPRSAAVFPVNLSLQVHSLERREVWIKIHLKFQLLCSKLDKQSHFHDRTDCLLKYAGVNTEPRVSGRATAVRRSRSEPPSRVTGPEWTSTPLGRLWDPGLPFSGCATPQARHEHERNSKDKFPVRLDSLRFQAEGLKAFQCRQVSIEGEDPIGNLPSGGNRQNRLFPRPSSEKNLLLPMKECLCFRISEIRI
ncbi:hypothetical protein AVEN_2841-1 [Araneus ventricosus]|uniref:Uncharacterized protein n=1 Tax=Araneus ventricosus TaxID=182803 RepID=A0A4Y2DSS8_ARAVE|nr:hypothetical protein AVEN_2841-1 [Araneus ventricosus]